jgi:lactate dehydrogenase-like 2-hydroxyacid dehydrogenase
LKIMFYSLRPFDELQYAEKFSKEYGIEFAWTSEYPSRDNVSLAKGCDAVCTTPCDMSAPMVDAFAELGVRFLPCRSIGYDHIDLAEAKKHGMRVSNVGYDPGGVANYSVMLMLMCLRRMPQIMARAGVQDFTLKGKMGHDISRCTVGVIGTGRIGKTVIRSLSGFGCRILAYDLYRNRDVAGMAEYVDLDTLFAQSDILTLHVNVTPENEHIINAEALQKCRDGVIIVNAARGKLIDTAALIAGLKSGRVGAAALDVMEDENGLYYYNLTGRIIDNNDMAVLRSFPNVILSPHTAFYTDDAVESMVEGIFRSVDCFAKGIRNPMEIAIP